jgi:hypothetical protein
MLARLTQREYTRAMSRAVDRWLQYSYLEFTVSAKGVAL